MLAFLRRKQKGLKWILWVVIIILGAGMVALFVPGNFGGASEMTDQEVAQVADRTISRVEYRKQYYRLMERYREMYKLDQQDPELVKQLGIGQQALNQLITSYAIVSEARRLGLDATPEELRQEIARTPVFQNQGQFIGADRYQQILEASNLTVTEFEEDVRREIIREKLLRLLTDGIISTPEEVRQEFVSRSQEAKVKYVAVDKKDLKDAEVDEAKLRDFYNKNKDSYRLGETRRIDYVFVLVDPLNVKVSDEQIDARLATMAPEERVHARHILVKAPDDQKPAPEAQKKAEDLLARARAGEDFAKLAKEFSEDAASAPRGGDLGFFGRGQMMPEFERTAFTMRPGEFQMTRSPYGFHVIQLLEKTTSNVESQRPMVRFQLQQLEAGKQARNLAYQVVNAAKKGKPFAEVAKEHKLQIKTSPFFNLGDPVPGMMVRNDFNERIFGMKKGDVAPPYQGPGGFYVAQVAEIKPPEIQPFEQVRARVAEQYTDTRREELAREEAFAFQNAAKADFEQAAKKSGLKVTTTGFFKKGTNVDETLRFSGDFHDRAFKMAEGEVSPPISIAGKYVIFQLVDKSDVDMAKFESEKASIERELTDRKKSEFFGAYVRNLIEEMRKKNEIVINQQVLDAEAS